MKQILIIDCLGSSRRWVLLLVERLEAAGYRVGLSRMDAAPRSGALDRLLRLEARRLPVGLAARSDEPFPLALDQPDLVIDLTGSAPRQSAPVLQIRFSGHVGLEDGVTGVFGDPPRPELTVLLDGNVIGAAQPMLDDRIWLTRMTDNLLASATTLLAQSVSRYFAGKAVAQSATLVPPAPLGRLQQLYWPNFLRGLGKRLGNKLLRRKPFYWQVAYRVVDGPAIAQTAALDGLPFTVLPDDGQRFYADPFLFEHNGTTWLFVEEFPYSTGKGIISVAQWQGDGFSTPQPVLEEPHHLSYPQVFAEGDEIFMLPESSGGSELVLYRASQFPHRWQRDTVLVSGRELNDATLLRHDDRFWLFCTERLPGGSASDTLVILHAENPRGPWLDHKSNPITIDRRSARLGGAFVRAPDGTITLPVQDGSLGYGGGLGLLHVIKLDDGEVVLSQPEAIAAGPAWNRQGIHTLNRMGNIEVVDSAG